MKIHIEGTPKEIVDLVRKLQGRLMIDSNNDDPVKVFEYENVVVLINTAKYPDKGLRAR